MASNAEFSPSCAHDLRKSGLVASRQEGFAAHVPPPRHRCHACRQATRILPRRWQSPERHQRGDYSPRPRRAPWSRSGTRSRRPGRRLPGPGSGSRRPGRCAGRARSGSSPWCPRRRGCRAIHASMAARKSALPARGSTTMDFAYYLRKLLQTLRCGELPAFRPA